MRSHKQVDDDNLKGQWSLFYRLRNVFQNADQKDDQQTFEAVQHVLGDQSVEDTSVHSDSPYRHRPTYLDDPSP